MATNFSLLNPIIKRDAPDAVVYDLSEAGQATITLPVGSTWSSGLHWHEKHVEFLRVVKGSVKVTLGDQVCTITGGRNEEAVEVRVDRNVRHEWRRTYPNDGEEVVVVERVDPEDGEKAVFFWNLNGVMLKAQSLACPPYMPTLSHHILLNIWVKLSLFMIFRDLDNLPVFIDVLQAFRKRGFIFAERTLGDNILRGIDRLVSHLILFVAAWIAWVFGISSVRSEFTPADVRQRWAIANMEKQKRKTA